MERLHSTFRSGKTRDYQWRLKQIKAIKQMVIEQENEICEAVGKDMKRPREECILAEIVVTLGECDTAISNLKNWMKPTSPGTPLALLPATSKLYYEPKGIVLVMSPWNYPVQLILVPLVSAIAAGNCCVLKPSELSENTSNWIAETLPKYVDMDAVDVVLGDASVAKSLLEEKFDHILYTGNATIARHVMAAASRHLTPCTLELGGKSPCIINSDANIEVAARRICFGKFLNAGQTCVAPDYLLVHEKVADKLVECLKSSVEAFYGTDPKLGQYTRIISDRHFQRLKSLLEEEGACKVIFGGECDETERYIAPTVVEVLNMESNLMKDEIFGPILPIVKVSSVDDAIDFVNKGPHPLALYAFSGSSKVQQHVLESTSSGGVCFNDVVMHVTNINLPFGGVGESGMGCYHGHWGFLELSHKRSVVNKYTFLDPSLRYPPWTDKKIYLLKKML